MTLDAMEFIRRFAMHILPKGFVRIWHYEILSSTSKSVNALLIKDQLPQLPEIVNKKERPEIFNPEKCPCCKKEMMETLLHFNNNIGSNWQKIYWPSGPGFLLQMRYSTISYRERNAPKKLKK